MGSRRFGEFETVGGYNQSTSVGYAVRRTTRRVFKKPATVRDTGRLETSCQLEGRGIEGDEALVVQLAQRHLEESTALEIHLDAIVRERNELSDSHAGIAHQKNALVEEAVRCGKAALQLPVDVRWERSRKAFGDLGIVRAAKEVVWICAKPVLFYKPPKISADAKQHREPRTGGQRIT
jgi:hypothetical protein